MVAMALEKIVHQIWFRESPNPLPSAFLESWRRAAEDAGCQYMLHIDVEGPYAAEINAAPEWTRKSDIFRYQILWQYGGIYVDADIENVGPLDEDLFAEPWLVWENENETPLLASHALGMPKGSSLMLAALEAIRAGRSGIPAFATGPGLLTELLPRHPTRVLPAATFAPLYFNGGAAAEYAGPVYGRHVWGTTRSAYGKLDMPSPLVRDGRQEMAHRLKMAGLRKVYPVKG